MKYETKMWLLATVLTFVLIALALTLAWAYLAFIYCADFPPPHPCIE